MTNHDTGKVDAKKARIIVGDCLEVLKGFESDSIDSLVTDPPYFLTNDGGNGFMGKEWDSLSPANAIAESYFRLMRLDLSTGAAAAAQEPASTPQTELSLAGPKPTPARSAGRNVGEPQVRSNQSTFSAPELVITKAEALVLCKEWCPSHTALVAKLPSHARFVGQPLPIGASTPKNIARTVAGILLDEPAWLESAIASTSTGRTESERNSSEAKIGNSSESKSISATTGYVGDAASNVASFQSNAITSSRTEYLEIISRLISLRSVKAAIRESTKSQSFIPTLSEVFHRKWAREAYRVVKPGGHGLVFNGTRTYHRMVSALEDEGWEIRDTVCWLYGQGFPKSLNVAKAGAGDKWEGWGTALKPSHEPIVLIRKPISEKNVAANVLKHGVGGLNIDGCRIEAADQSALDAAVKRMTGNLSKTWVLRGSPTIQPKSAKGRFPANLVLSHSPHCTDDQCDIECAIVMLDEQSLAGGMHSAGRARDKQMVKKGGNPSFEIKGPHNMRRLGDSGGASRFFFNSRYSEEECSQSSASSVSEISSLDLNLDGFAQKLAAIADLPEEIASSDLLAAFTVAIQSGLKQKSARNIEAILNTGARCLREFRLTSISNNNPVSLAATQRLTDIITTTLSPLTCSGSADRATSGTTPPNLERGAKDSANRFIYCAKISPGERNAGLEGMPDKVKLTQMRGSNGTGKKNFEGGFSDTIAKNTHPTVKPQKLMRYLCKLVTPPGGLVLDPFMGSGSTGLAALSEGFRFIGIEREPEYFEIAEKRIFNHFPEAKKEVQT